MLIDGDPGQGKSILAIDIAVRLTSARQMPDGYQPPEPVAVLLLPGEDNLKDTVVPRLVAAGADLCRVYFWSATISEPPVFPDACPRLQELITRTQSRLVLLDPFFAFLGRDISCLNDRMIRRALQPLARVAEATQAALWLNRHLTKTVGKPATHRGLGSMAILGLMRTAFLLGPDPDDPSRRVLACTKNNLAAFPPALGFRIGQTSEGVATIEWLGPVDRTADDLVVDGRRRGEAVPQALRFLRDQLARGPCDRQTLLEQATSAGISFRTIERAKAQLGVVSIQKREAGRNVWYWALPVALNASEHGGRTSQ
jgi:hypothetical protein